MTSPITDVDDFTDPVTAPDDGDPLNVASIVPTALQALANRTRNLANRLGLAAGGGEWTYENSPRVRVVMIDPDSGWESSTVNNQTVGWSKVSASATSGVGPVLLSKENGASWSIPITNFVPSGSTITRVRALVKPGIARADPNNMQSILTTQVFDFDTPEFVSDVDVVVRDDESVVIQTIDHTGLALLVNRATTRTLLRIFCGNDAATNADRIFAIEVQYNDIGPRND